MLANCLCHAPIEDTSTCVIWNHALEGEYHPDPTEGRLKYPPKRVAFLGDIIWEEEDGNNFVPQLSREFWVPYDEILRLIRARSIDEFRRFLENGRPRQQQQQQNQEIDDDEWDNAEFFNFEDPTLPHRPVPRSSLVCVEFDSVAMQQTFRKLPMKITDLEKQGVRKGSGKKDKSDIGNILDTVTSATGFRFNNHDLIFAFVLESFFFEVPAKLGCRNDGKKPYLVANLDLYKEHKEFFKERVHLVIDSAIVFSAEKDWDKAIDRLFPLKEWDKGKKAGFARCTYFRIWNNIVGWAHKRSEMENLEAIRNSISRRLRNEYKVRFLPIPTADKPWDSQKMTKAQEKQASIYFYPQIDCGKPAPHVALNPNTAADDIAIIRDLEEDYDARNAHNQHLMDIAEYRTFHNRPESPPMQTEQSQHQIEAPPALSDDEDPLAITENKRSVSPTDEYAIYDFAESTSPGKRGRKIRNKLFDKAEPKNRMKVGRLHTPDDKDFRVFIEKPVSQEQRMKAVLNAVQSGDSELEGLAALFTKMGEESMDIHSHSQKKGLPTPPRTQFGYTRNDARDENMDFDTLAQDNNDYATFGNDFDYDNDEQHHQTDDHIDASPSDIDSQEWKQKAKGKQKARNLSLEIDDPDFITEDNAESEHSQSREMPTPKQTQKEKKEKQKVSY